MSRDAQLLREPGDRHQRDRGTTPDDVAQGLQSAIRPEVAGNVAWWKRAVFEALTDESSQTGEPRGAGVRSFSLSLRVGTGIFKTRDRLKS